MSYDINTGNLKEPDYHYYHYCHYPYHYHVSWTSSIWKIKRNSNSIICEALYEGSLAANENVYKCFAFNMTISTVFIYLTFLYISETHTAYLLFLYICFLSKSNHKQTLVSFKINVSHVKKSERLLIPNLSMLPSMSIVLLNLEPRNKRHTLL